MGCKTLLKGKRNVTFVPTGKGSNVSKNTPPIEILSEKTIIFFFLIYLVVIQNRARTFLRRERDCLLPSRSLELFCTATAKSNRLFFFLLMNSTPKPLFCFSVQNHTLPPSQPLLGLTSASRLSHCSITSC